MNSHLVQRTNGRRSFTKRWARTFSIVLLASLLFSLIGFVPQENARAQTTMVTILAQEVESGNPVPEFRFIINKDIAHENASVMPPESYSPLVATGDQASNTVSLPEGKYLVTLLAGPFPPTPSGYKMWGKHFTVDGTLSSMTVAVDLVPNPLPLSAIRVRVFHDNLVVNGEDDIPQEEGLEGFHIVISDPVGEVTVDWFGNPLCTEYSDFPGGTPVPGTGGACFTGPDGYALIPNLPPGKYEVEVIPPDGSGWMQSTTIEGTHAIDAWIEEGADGYSTEEGFLQAVVWFGFLRPCEFGNAADDCPSNDTAGTGTIVGRIRRIVDLEALGAVTLGEAIDRPIVALNHIGGNDEQVYMGRGNPDGTFTIPNVPAGLYQLVYWDFPQDYIIQFRTVQVGDGELVDMGDLGIPRWFGTIKGYAYVDNGVARDGTVIAGGQGNGLRDCYDPGGGIDPNNVATCEPGIPGQDLDIRFKDGSIRYATFADSNGYYEFPEYFEWEHFLVWEVGFGRMAQVGTAGYATDDFGNPLPGYPNNPINQAEPGLGALLQAQLTWAGYTNWIDAGKRPYGPGENGGISGVVFYATTRNEFNPRYAAAEDYEPGIPDVTVNLYEAVLDSNGQPVACTAVGPGCPYGNGELMRASDTPLQTVQTDSWYGNLPSDCVVPPLLGQPGYTDPQCLELPRTFNQIKDGVFDGGYAFEGLAEGSYIVEVSPPPGYQVIREEDQNTDQGDDFVPEVPPAPCAGPLHLVNDPRNPADGTQQPLCDSRFVSVVNGFNAASDFFLMTVNGVPPPGLLRGLLLDDLTVQLDPNSPIYADKRGIPNAPVGILDFAGNEITRVYTDENGYWEVLLPSTYTALCPIPSGICPGMYQVIGNYPGDPLNPDPRWNPNYGTLRLVFDIWPGKTTYADVAIFPITGFVQTPESNFAAPPICEIPATTPNLMSVSQPYGSDTDAGTFTINGSGFGATQGAGSVTLDGVALPAVSWSDTAIEVEFVSLSLVSAGPHQLLVTNDGGATSPQGITFHVLGAGYSPPQRHVGSGQTYATIQQAIDAASDGDLILVHPGAYYENVILDKNVKLQGYGPNASLIDGRFFNFGGLTPADFQARIQSINGGAGPVGPQPVPMGQVVTVVAASTGQHGSAYPTQIDGFAIRGGSRVRGNVAVPSQGGGIYAHAFAHNLVISNNLVQSNAGNAGGGIVLGQAYMANPDAGNALDNENDSVRIHHNRVLNNGGVRLAGGVALFNGAQDYQIERNVICGNYSAEYGAGISHFGMSPGGRILDNEVLFNYAFDEGGGVMIAGEQPVGNPLALSPGSGEVLVDGNRIQGNFSNDDGGGIRLLQPVDGPVTIQNNMVVNNMAADFGGGLSLDDALDVRIINNTIARNISTATAEDADRTTCSPPALGTCAHAAGLSSEAHSPALMAARSPSTDFSDPLLFNNIFWENEAFRLDGTGGLPSAGFIDLEVVGTTSPSFMTPNYSILTNAYGSGTGNLVGANPAFVEAVATDFVAVPFAGDPQFVTVLIKTSPADPQGDYHIGGGSPAVDAGVSAFGGAGVPVEDFDGETRPQGFDADIGADELPGGLTLEADLGLTKDDGQTQVVAGATVSYTIVATNAGPAAVSGASVIDTFPAVLTGVTWSCSASTGGACGAASGSGDINTTVDLPAGGTATFVASGVIQASASGSLSNTASVSPPPGILDSFPANNSATDDDVLLPAPPVIYFSTRNNSIIPGLPRPWDDADIYGWNGFAFSRLLDATAAGLPATADVDAMLVVDSDTFYLSFTADGVPVPGVGPVRDEDVVLYDAGSWSLFFDGSDVGLKVGGEDVDAFEILPDGSVLISPVESAVVPGLVGFQFDEDLLRCTGTFGPNTSCTWSMFFEGSDINLTANSEDLDGVAASGGDIYLSTYGPFTIPGLTGSGDDVFTCNAATTGPVTDCASVSLFFDGSGNGLSDNVDAFDVP